MFPEMKYIVIRVRYQQNMEIAGRPSMPANPDQLQEHPVIFPKALTHAEMAQVIQFSEDFSQFRGDDAIVVGAGFLRYSDMEGWVCYGESESLKNDGVAGYKSRGQVDNDLLATLHVQHGLVFEEDEE